MGYYLGVDIGSVNAKLAVIDERGGVIQFDTEKVTSSPRAAVSSLIARQGQKLNLQEIIAAGVTGSGRGVIPEELGWTEYSSSLAIASGLLRRYLVYDNLAIVGQLTGQDVTSLVDSLKARVAAVDEKVKLATDKPVVFYEIDATDPTKPYTYGPGTFGDLLITRAGGENLATAAGITDPYPQLSLEQIVAANPGVIVLGDSMWGVTPESIATRPGWEKLAAVTNEQVHPFDDNLVSRPGPRLVDGLEQLAKLLHPDLFQ